MKNNRLDDSGFVVVLLAAALLVLICGFAGLAIDVGRGYFVKGEVQNAADAAALAGSGTLFSKPPLPTDPNFDAAKLTATRFVTTNQAAGANLTADNAQVEAGFWDLDAKQMKTTPIYSCAGTVTPCTPGGAPPGCACEQRGVPAVKVTVQKPALDTYFAKILGWSTTSPTAASIAARGYPTVGKVSFPFAVTKCMTEYFMQNNLYGEVVNGEVIKGQVINIPQAYAGVSNCNTGNWSSLGLLDNSNNSVQDLLTGKTSAVTVSIGDTIMAQQGVRDNLYQMIKDDFLFKTVLVPVVADSVMAPNTTSKVTGFMEFTITGVQTTGALKYISGTFVKYYEDPNVTASGIGGTPSNTLSPPVLIR